MNFETAWRYVRILLGAALVIYGWYHPREDLGAAALILGLVAMAAGLLNFGGPRDQDHAAH